MKRIRSAVLLIAAVAFSIQVSHAQSNSAQRVFRLDGGDVTYVSGINDAGQLQTIYWGRRLPATQEFASPKPGQGSSSFDMPSNTTPQEFIGWGGGLYVEPDLKVTFPDGNRD